MIALSTGALRADEAVRVVRALGAHRYVAGRLHLVHALVFEALADPDPLLIEACEWARATVASPALDLASRDEALWRRCSDREVVAALESFWIPGPRSAVARSRLAELLGRLDLAPAGGAPFDEAAEGDLHPVLVDAGWELLPLADLDPQRHRGAIAAFGDALAFESARFEEETALPPEAHLQELPAIGPTELLSGVGAQGDLAAPLVVWAQGHPVYLDYVLRGVRRAAGLPEGDPD